MTEPQTIHANFKLKVFGATSTTIIITIFHFKTVYFLSKSGAQVVLNCHAAILSSWHFLRQDGRREVDERIVFILSCHLSETLYPFVNICLQTVLSHYPDTQRWHHTDSGTFQVLLRNITKKKKRICAGLKLPKSKIDAWMKSSIHELIWHYMHEKSY